MIDLEADRPVYKQLADLVREEIRRGRLKPDQRLPAEKDYVDRYGISRDSVRRAMGLLRTEGLITTTARGSRVRVERQRQELVLGPDDRVTARIPDPATRLRLGIREGTPVLVVERAGGADPEVLAADRWVIVGASPTGRRVGDPASPEGA
ncbi:GntR family transcriptional regulator [Streptosporangium sp. NPDC001559]|uniref:GntR family transcriptional regulator n=1 Tax=Streptosporangium sp. NPDC001559 TaxID=3366187 RepID=UPI0036E88DA1